MKKGCFISIILLLSVFVYGCSKGAESNQVDFDLIASEKTLPSESYFDFGESKIERSSSKSEFGDTWAMYGLEDKIPDVNFDDKSVYFIGVYESGSCPYTIEKIITSKDKESLIVSFSSPDGACTADANPRTFVIQIDKKTSEEIDNVKIEE